jgi:hypothetical protein
MHENAENPANPDTTIRKYFRTEFSVERQGGLVWKPVSGK